MVWAVTARGQDTDTASSTNLVIPSFTPGANSLLVVALDHSNDAGSLSLSGHDDGVSWAQIYKTTLGGGREHELWACITGSSPSAGTITITKNYGWTYAAACVEITGDFDTAPTAMTDLFGTHQSVELYTTSSDNTLDVTLSAFASADNMTLALAADEIEISNDYAFTEVQVSAGANNNDISVLWYDGADTNPEIQFDNWITARLSAIEVKEAAGGGTTPVYNDSDLRWSLIHAILNNSTLQWNVLNAVQNDSSLLWSLLVSAQNDTDLRWSLIQAINNDSTLQWSLIESVLNDSTLQWNVLNTVLNDSDLRWSVLEAVANDTDLRWSLLNFVLNDSDLRWNIASSLTPVYNDSTLQWSMIEAVLSDSNLRWSLLENVVSESDIRWHILNAVLNNTDLRWSLLEAVQQDVELRWSLLEAINNSLEAQWSLLTAVQQDSDLRWSLVQAVANQVTLQWDLTALQAVFNDLDIRWSMIESVAGDIHVIWNFELDTIPVAGDVFVPSAPRRVLSAAPPTRINTPAAPTRVVYATQRMAA